MVETIGSPGTRNAAVPVRAASSTASGSFSTPSRVRTVTGRPQASSMAATVVPPRREV